jgi:hypothetical protein
LASKGFFFFPEFCGFESYTKFSIFLAKLFSITIFFKSKKGLQKEIKMLLGTNHFFFAKFFDVTNS